MGYGFYSHEAHLALAKSHSKRKTEEVFAQRECHPLMNPHGVRLRESRDSVAHPASFGVVFALDVTGSMGDIPVMLAQTQLPTFMTTIMELGVKDPQLLFMAVGDVYSDRAPLQVGQFESAAKEMDQWLTRSFLEGNGGGTNEESYETAMYFGARHTEMDCWTKRRKRGYFFMTGDELPYGHVSAKKVSSVIGDEIIADLPTEVVTQALSETFEPFFLIPDLGRRARCERRWRDLLGDNVVCMESAEDTCRVAAGIVALGEGVVRDVGGLAATFAKEGVSKERVGAIVRALLPFAASRGKDGASAPKFTGTPVSAFSTVTR